MASVHYMCVSAGETILISGFTLSCCFASLCFFDLILMRGFGAGCLMVVLSVMASNLTLTPVLLLLAPSFFEKVRLAFTLHRGCGREMVPCSATQNGPRYVSVLQVVQRAGQRCARIVLSCYQ